MFESEELFEIEPPSADRVARRALVLAAIACRSGIEQDAGNSEAEKFRSDVLEWLSDAGAVVEAEPGEVRLLRSPLGTLPERDVMDGSWRAEGLGVLAWALELYHLPDYQHAVSPTEVADCLGFLEPEGLRLADEAAIRTPDEIVALANRLLTLHWRLRQFSLKPEHMDFVGFVQTASFAPLDATGLVFRRGDLAIDGVALSDVPEARWRECMSIASERQQAANWLCGDELLYSDVTCDT